LDRANGRKVDGRRVVVDYERGRTKQEWVPRRLGGGKGDKRRDRDTERLIRELKKTDPLLVDKSRSRSPQPATNPAQAVETKVKTNDEQPSGVKEESKQGGTTTEGPAVMKKEERPSRSRSGEKRHRSSRDDDYYHHRSHRDRSRGKESKKESKKDSKKESKKDYKKEKKDKKDSKKGDHHHRDVKREKSQENDGAKGGESVKKEQVGSFDPSEAEPGEIQ